MSEERRSTVPNKTSYRTQEPRHGLAYCPACLDPLGPSEAVVEAYRDVPWTHMYVHPECAVEPEKQPEIGVDRG